MSIPGHSAGKPPLDREVIYPGKYQQGSESEDGAMKCSNCGYENGDEAVFCLNCGEKIGNKSEGTLHGPHPSTPKTGEGGKGSCLRYILALLACAGVYIAWSAMGTFVFGWKHGGGMIPTLILMAIIAGVWKTIVRRKR